MSVNRRSTELCDFAATQKESLRVACHRSNSGTRILDFGVQIRGSLAAGTLLARICMGDNGRVELKPGDRSIWSGPQVEVMTDAPIAACMQSQYAGWPIKHEKFFAMGSGPMRAKRGREPVLEKLALSDDQPIAVGVLECDFIPSDAICQMIADECHVSCEQLTLCVAPTRSLAGTIQVVARSIETCLHKLFDLQFDLRQIISGYGTTPLPPTACDFVQGIGRTNDAIMYGSHVTLWVECEDQQIIEIGPKIPSSASIDWGQPFAKLFKKYDYEFYKVDPGLFAPAEVRIVNLQSGNSFAFGTIRSDCIQASFTG